MCGRSLRFEEESSVTKPFYWVGAAFQTTVFSPHILCVAQDQAAHFPLEPYLAAFRAAAVETGRADFALAACLAASAGVRDPELLAETLLHPALLEPLPQSSDASLAGSYFFADVSLAGRRSPSCESVLYGGSDYSAARRIRSGLANNPTFCRFFAGDAVLDSIRLSREFFDLGPFRASAMRRVAENRYELEEVVDFLTNPKQFKHLADDGRFSASMSFPLRPHDVQTMSTKVRAILLSDGIDLEFQIDAPTTAWSLEFGFRDGGTVEGGVRDDDGSWVLPDGRGSYRDRSRLNWLPMLGSLLRHDPATHQVRIQAVGQGHRGYRHAARSASRYDLRLELGGMRPPASPNHLVVVGSVHVSTKNLSGHDHPYADPGEKDDFTGRLRCSGQSCNRAVPCRCS